MKKGITSIVLGIFAAATMAVFAFAIDYFLGDYLKAYEGDMMSLAYELSYKLNVSPDVLVPFFEFFINLPAILYGVAGFFAVCAILSTTLKFTNVLMLIVGIFCCVMALTIVPGIFAICAANSGNKAIERAKNK